METSNGALINRRRTKLHYQPPKGLRLVRFPLITQPRCLYSPIISHCQELPEYLVCCMIHWHEKPHKISNFSGNGDPASWSLVPDSVIILPKTQPFCPFSMENFPCCTLLGILTRFIFMGNQPFFSNGESNGKSRSSWCAACTISHTSLPRSTMEMPMENLLIGKGYANE